MHVWHSTERVIFHREIGIPPGLEDWHSTKSVTQLHEPLCFSIIIIIVMPMLVDHLSIVKVQQSSPSRVSFEAEDREGHFLSSRRTPQLALEEIKKSKTRSTHLLSADLGGLGPGPCWGHMTGLWAFCILSPHSRCVLNGNLGGLVVGSQ